MEVKLTRSAAKNLSKIQNPYHDRIVSRIKRLQEEILGKKLKGFDNLYRDRLGDYRIVYEVIADNNQVIIRRIGHRSDIYRNL